MSRILIGAAFAVLLSAPLHAQSVLLRYKFTAGQVHRYRGTTETNMQVQAGGASQAPMHMVMHLTLRQTVKSVRPSDGAATVVSQVESVQILDKGTETSLPEAFLAKLKKPTTQVILPTGQILSTTVNPFWNADLGNDSLSDGPPILPTDPVKVGDTWTGFLPSSIHRGMQIAFVSTLTHLDQKNGRVLAAIRQTQAGALTRAQTQAALAGTATQIVDVTGGTLQSDLGTSETQAASIFTPLSKNAKSSSMKMHLQIRYTLLQIDTPAAPSLSVMKTRR